MSAGRDTGPSTSGRNDEVGDAMLLGRRHTDEEIGIERFGEIKAERFAR